MTINDDKFNLVKEMLVFTRSECARVHLANNSNFDSFDDYSRAFEDSDYILGYVIASISEILYELGEGYRDVL